jgi:hypothetical protein
MDLQKIFKYRIYKIKTLGIAMNDASFFMHVLALSRYSIFVNLMGDIK